MGVVDFGSILANPYSKQNLVIYEEFENSESDKLVTVKKEGILVINENLDGNYLGVEDFLSDNLNDYDDVIISGIGSKEATLEFLLHDKKTGQRVSVVNLEVSYSWDDVDFSIEYKSGEEYSFNYGELTDYETPPIWALKDDKSLPSSIRALLKIYDITVRNWERSMYKKYVLNTTLDELVSNFELVHVANTLKVEYANRTRKEVFQGIKNAIKEKYY